MKKRNITLAVLIPIIFSACQQPDEEKAKWDGNDYYTGRDTVIDDNLYRQSSLGYYYFSNEINVMRYYPNSGHREALPVDEHRNGTFLNSATHVENGGMAADAGDFAGSHSSGFGSTARGGGSGAGE